MRKLLLRAVALVALALGSAPAWAQSQTVGGIGLATTTCPAATVINPGYGAPIFITSQGALCVTGTGSGGSTSTTIVGPLGSVAPASGVATTLDTTDAAALQSIITNTAAGVNRQVVGDSASGSADSGSNPVKIGGVYLTTLPTLTTSQRANAGMDVNGNILVSTTGIAAALSDAVSNNGVLTRKGTSPSASGILENGEGAFNGASWDRIRTIQGSDGTGLGIQGVAEAPHSTNGTTGSATTAVASSLVLKASSGNLYSVNVTTGATAGFVMFFNATAAPADGAVTPVYCSVLAANSSFNMANTAIPALFSTGITVVFSSTGCFSKTASATAFISGQFQ